MNLPHEVLASNRIKEVWSTLSSPRVKSAMPPNKRSRRAQAKHLFLCRVLVALLVSPVW